MKKLFVVFFFLLFVINAVFSQSCLPDGIIFTTQSQIDSFQINYPNCTEIEGSVEIIGNEIFNLNGLHVLTYIGDDFTIMYNSTLINLTGLDNITSIGGDFYMREIHRIGNLKGLNKLNTIRGALTLSLLYNLTVLTGLDNLNTVGDSVFIEVPALKSLTGLNNLTYIGGTLFINVCYALENLSALANLNYIGGDLWIESNLNMGNLIGLNNLTSIGGNLYIEDLEHLVNLTGLNNVTSIGGYINIDGNNFLTSLTGLENISAGSICELHIFGNTNLSKCEVKSVCDYLVSPNGKMVIHDNAPGCNNKEEIEAACESSFLPEGITFSTQAQIDNFQIKYPGCIDIEGDVKIASSNGISISDLNGLSKLTSIGGSLKIEGNEVLNSLNGLNNVSYIGGILSFVRNNSLTNISGLDNLTSIGGDLSISGNENLSNLTGLNNVAYIGENLLIENNRSLTNLTGFSKLTYVGNNLLINNNDFLTSLTGLNNIDASYIKNISIQNNSSLSYCEVQNICTFLEFSNGTIDIYNNATGCNNPEEIADACGVSVSDNIGMLRKESEIKDLQIQQSRFFLIGMGIIVLIIGFIALLFIRLNKVRAHHKSVVLEQKLLRLQMNPHFMFNSLADLQGFIWSKDTITANEYLSSFSKLLRLILENSRQEFVPVEKEISAITHYLKLQSLRYKDKFEYNINIDEEIEEEDMLIPPMLAQPFIENSIEHGIIPKESTGHIEVNFLLDKNLINIEITDDGIGFKRSSELKKSKHPGQESLAMKITRERLTMIYKKYKQKIQFNISDILDDKNNVAGARISFAVPFSRI